MVKKQKTKKPCRNCKKSVVTYQHKGSYGETTFDVCHHCGNIHGKTTSGEIKSMLEKDEKMFYQFIKCGFLVAS